MKKSYIPKLDRNTYIDNYFASSMIPFQSTFEQSSLKIIELDDSNSSDSVEYNYDQKHAWCYVNKESVPKHNESKYKANIKARAKRRMNRVSPEIVSKNINYLTNKNDLTDAENSNSNALYNETTERIPNPLNCFTIINNDLADSDQTLSSNEGMKIIECGDVILESDYKKYNSKETHYNRNIDSKRTIWIYSFKNRNTLAEDGSNNVSTEESTSSSSLDNTEYKERIATPIPSYIPRLNFYVAATLPPVTEVTESLHATPDNIDKTETLVSKLQINPKHLEQRSPLSTAVPSHNIINWMALSPRERRRTIRTNITEDLDDFEKDSVSIKQTENLPLKIDIDLTYVIAKRNEVQDNEITSDKSNDELDDNIDEKGDHIEIRHLKKPQIILKGISPNKITEPIGKLNGDEWIGNKIEQIEKTLDIDSKIIEVQEKPVDFIRCAGDRLFNKNMTILKPVEWTQYLPITESMPSLHLSLPSDINDEKKSWFKYIIKYFQCCKMCK